MHRKSDTDEPIKRPRMDLDVSGKPGSACASEASDTSMDKLPPTMALEDHSNVKRSEDIAPPGGCPNKQSDTNPEEDTNQVNYKSFIKEQYKHLLEQTDTSNSYFFPDIDTDMYIVTHTELTQMVAGEPLSEEVLVTYNDIFSQENPTRSVLTVGISGIGKTVCVHKFILDWAEEKANQEINFIFPLPFRVMNFLKEKHYSILDLLQHFFPMTMNKKTLENSDNKILFIFDGLDECQYPLDFQNNQSLSDVTEPASVDVLLTNLIKGNLLPSALLWVTSRPETVSRIPHCFINRETEVQGFSDACKETYIKMKIRDQHLAGKILEHLKISPCLYGMCQIPVYCWILVIVLQKLLSETESGDIPQTLTQIYTHFLFIQTDITKEKLSSPEHTVENVIFKLSKLAFQQLEKGNFIFYEDDLKNSDLSVTEACQYPGVCADSVRGLKTELVFHFVHLSLQEHLAALYVFLSFANREEGTCCHPTTTSKLSCLFKASSVYELLESAVDLSLRSEDGQLDFFLRFLIGFSLESNQTLLQGLLLQEGSTSDINRRTVEYVRRKIQENPFPEKCLSLFYCLSELHDLCSLEEEVQSRLSSASESRCSLTPAQCSAVAFLLLNSGKELETLDMRKYTESEECALRLLPVLKATRSATLRDCNITVRGCRALASILKSNTTLVELDLSSNDLQDSGFTELYPGLKDCSLNTVKLWYCNLTLQSCELLANLLSYNTSLKVLNLSRNSLEDPGLAQICSGLLSPNCQLQTLKLNDCGITTAGCEALESAVSRSSSLRELSLNGNKLPDEGLTHLCAGLSSSHCRLRRLELRDCGLTASSCTPLAKALSATASPLRHLTLSKNEIQDEGLKLLSEGTQHSALEILQLRYCGLTASSCVSLMSVHPHLTELDLSANNLQDKGVMAFASFLSGSNCKLKKLQLSYCDVSDVGAAVLASALTPGRLEQLELSGNRLQDPELKLQLRALNSTL